MKKKLIISICSLVTAVILVVVGVVIALAFMKQNVGSNIKVTYRANDVVGTVTGTYSGGTVEGTKYMTTDGTPQGRTSIEFNGNEDTNSSAGLLPQEDIQLTKTLNSATFTYTFTNTAGGVVASHGYKIFFKYTDTDNDDKNLKININGRSLTLENLTAYTWDFGTVYGEDDEGYIASGEGANGTVVITIVVSVDNVVKDAKFSGEFLFDLYNIEQTMPESGGVDISATVAEIDQTNSDTVAAFSNPYGITRADVTSISFSDSISEASAQNYAYSWDVSSNGNGAVMAYAIEDTTSDSASTEADSSASYKLVIAQDGGVAVNDLTKFFNFYTQVTEIDLTGLDTSNVTNMIAMFQKCEKLTTLDLSSLNTSNVTNVMTMFNYCSSLMSLDVSNFNTSNVTDMSGMFNYCSSLTSLDVSNFDTSNVTNMWSMFNYCSSLTSLDVSNFDTSNVTSMASMFQNCNKLTTLDVSNFDTSNVTDMSYMFNKCSSLTSLDLSNFDTSKVTSMRTMFQDCSSLTSLEVSNFDTSNVTNMSYMFNYCSSLTSLDLSNFNTSNVTNMNTMFQRCEKLTSLDVSNFDTSNVTGMSGMFGYCSTLTSLDVSNFDTSSVTDMSYMFCGCSSLTSLDVSNFDMTNETDTTSMFQYCSGLTNILVPDNMVVCNYTFNHMAAYDQSSFVIKPTMKILGTSHMWYNFGTENFVEFVNEGNTTVQVIDGILYSADGTTLISVPMGKTFEDNRFVLPEGVTTFDELCFSRNKHIETLVLPDSFVIIPDCTGNPDDSDVNYGNNLNIGIYKFTNISKYEVNDTNTNYMSYEGCLYSKDGTQLVAVPFNYVGELVIKEGTTSIKNDAIWYERVASITTLTKIVIASTITSIEEDQLAALNTLISKGITVEIAEGNTAYEIVEGTIVAKA